MSYSSSDPPIYSPPSPELKLYQAFIFSVPIFFTFILLLLFYVFYLRWRRVDWASLQMRSSYQTRGIISGPSESGLKKEVREMLPIFIFKESFLIKETQAVKHSYCRCSVCLGDYQANEKLQQIPCCGHTFHMLCIDSWLAAHSTCPLCRVSLFPPAKDAVATPHPQQDEGMMERDRENAGLQEDSHREYEPDFADSSCDVGQGICDEARRDEECEDVAEGSAVVVAVETRTRVETLPSLDHAEV